MPPSKEVTSVDRALRCLNVSDDVPDWDPKSVSEAQLLQLRESLAGLPSKTPSTAVPYRALCERLQVLVQPGEVDSARVALAASRVCLALLGAIPLAYDDLIFSTVVQHVSRTFVRASSAQNSKKERRGAKRSAPRQVDACDTVRVEDTIQFWQELVRLLSNSTIGRAHSGFPGAAAKGMAVLFQYAVNDKERALAVSGMEAIALTKNHGNPRDSIRILYNATLPLVLACLPAASRACLASMFVRVVNAEVDDMQQGARNPRTTPSPERTSSLHFDNDDVQPVTPGAQKTPGARVEAAESQLVISKSRVAAVGFLEHCCARVPEKADERAMVSDVLLRILRGVDGMFAKLFADFLPKLALHPRACVRLFSTELALVVIRLAPTSVSLAQCVDQLIQRVLSDRAGDKVPAVRAKAISCLAEVVSEAQSNRFEFFSSLFLTDGFALEQRAADEKSGVRKAAVQLAGALGRISVKAQKRVGASSADGMETTVDGSDELHVSALPGALRALRVVLKLLQTRAEDSVSGVRRAAIVSLTAIVDDVSTHRGADRSGEAFRAWLHGVLPRVSDTDPRCQDACLDAFQVLVVEAIGLNRSPYETDSSFVDVLIRSMQGGRSSIGQFACAALRMLTPKGAVTAHVLNALQRRVLDDERSLSADPIRQGAWAMLAEILCSNGGVALRQCVRRKDITAAATTEGVRSAIRIVAVLASDMGTFERQTLTGSFRRMLFDSSNWELENWNDSVRSIVGALQSFDESIGSELLQICGTELTRRNMQMSESATMAVLDIVGEVCVSFKLTDVPPACVVSFVQAVTDPDQASPRIRAMALIALGKLCLCEGMPAQSLSAMGVGQAPRNDPGLVSVLSFGEDLTRRCVSVFVRELDSTSHVATRNNAIMVLCDMCRRYTAVVEPYASRLAVRLEDPSELIRRQVFASITSLLQEDYIKIRGGAIFFRIVCALLDPSADLRNMARYTVVHVLHRGSKSLLAVSFVELVYVLNGCTENPAYNQLAKAHGGLATSCGSVDNFKQRWSIYALFLENLSAEQRLHLPGKLRSEVLALIVEEKLTLSESTGVMAVMCDTLALLKSSELRSMAGTASSASTTDRRNESGAVENDPSADGDEFSQPGHAPNALKKVQLLAKIQRVELRESTIPILLELRRLLESMRSPALQSVMDTLCSLMAPHHKELSEIIPDQGVCAEIEHALLRRARGRRALKKRTESAVDSPASVEIGSRREPLTSTPVALRDSRNNGAGLDTPISEGNAKNLSVSTPAAKMSVPRTRSRKSTAVRRREKSRGGLLSDEDEPDSYEAPDHPQSARLADAFQASPKLATIGRARGAPVGISIPIEGGASGFATALAQIEEANDVG